MATNSGLTATVRPVALALLAAMSITASSRGQIASQSEVDVSATVHYIDSGSGTPRKTKPSAPNVSHRTVVWLMPTDARQVADSRPAMFTMVQKGKEFHPDLMIVPVGSVVSFPNADPFFHNVFSLFNGRRFDLGLYQSGQTRTVEFNRAGVSYIFCNIHPEMTAVILSLKTPYYASPAPSGIATLHHVPEGNYTLEIWSELASTEALSRLSRNVTIGKNGADLGEIDIPVSSSAAGSHLNKFGMPYDTHSSDKPY